MTDTASALFDRSPTATDEVITFFTEFASSRVRGAPTQNVSAIA
jgi:hypothetical protein